MRIALVVVVSAVWSSSACDLLAVHCAHDDDCPKSQPFCVDDICVTQDEAERRGRTFHDDGEGDTGEGEGEGEEGEGEVCLDSNCAPGLCYDDADGELAEPNTCLPPDGTADCASTAGAPQREPEGPALWDVQATDAGDGCLNLVIAYWDREGDGEGGYAEAGQGGSSGNTQVPEYDGAHMHISHFCTGGVQNGIFVVDGAGHHSNTVCVGP